jgi:4-diphosphocytidyl-2-C-methyl-D-erythritol kinase
MAAPDRFAEAAPSKINLYLHVTGRRPDGYHLLDSLVVFAGAADRLTAEPADDLSLALTGPFAAGLAAEPDNLVLRAARALAGAAGIAPRARLTLEKNLPVASGIGGGSADAAAALRVLSRLWNVALPADTLHAIATKLGADVPVCLASRPLRMRGIGELLSPAPELPECGLLLVNPGEAVATPAVFRARSAAFSPEATLPTAWPDAARMAADLATIGNDLEAPARILCPAITDVIASIAATPDCRLARMSGSGATCFGLYPTPAEARSAAEILARTHLAWWCWGGDLHT